MHELAHRDGINVVVFGSLSPSGQRLNNLTGIAAVLRFVLPQLDEMVEADEGDLDSDDDASAGLSKEPEEVEEDEQDKNEERKSGSGNSHPSEADSAFMDDVFN